MADKQKLIDAINCKFPHQNITELYYNIGRALPFTLRKIYLPMKKNLSQKLLDLIHSGSTFNEISSS